MTAPDTSAPPLDLDAIEARIAACARLCAWEEGDGCREVATQRCAGGNCGLRLCEAHAEAHSNEAAHDTYPLPRNAVPEARDLLAEARRLRGMLDATAQAYDELMAQVWRATGETHEPPADVAALLARVEGLRAAALPAGHVAVDRVLYDAACRLASDVPRLQREVAAARREGAEAMREACAVTADDDAREAAVVVGRCADGTAERGEAVAWRQASEHLARAIRALPLPGGEP